MFEGLAPFSTKATPTRLSSTAGAVRVGVSALRMSFARTTGTASPSMIQPKLPIEIDAEYRAEQLVLSVSDRGPGFPMESAEKLFEKFYRGDGRKTGGLGLGLSIARGFVEAHGGKLTAENRDGGGARFTIRLPVRVTSENALESAS